MPTWLAFAYFTGDAFEVEGVAQDCPTDATGWGPTLDRMHVGLGIPMCHPFSHFVVELFLPVSV